MPKGVEGESAEIGTMRFGVRWLEAVSRAVGHDEVAVLVAVLAAEDVVVRKGAIVRPSLTVWVATGAAVAVTVAELAVVVGLPNAAQLKPPANKVTAIQPS